MAPLLLELQVLYLLLSLPQQLAKLLFQQRARHTHVRATQCVSVWATDRNSMHASDAVSNLKRISQHQKYKI